MTPTHFGISITIDESTGEVMSAYFQIRKGKSHVTVEYADGAALADYNRNGELIGVELLAPWKVSIMNQIAANESVELLTQAKEFMKNAGPRQLVA
jgi:uncharacterized protein YuzE